jgi:hypothetical protein
VRVFGRHDVLTAGPATGSNDLAANLDYTPKNGDSAQFQQGRARAFSSEVGTGSREETEKALAQ